MLLVIDAQKDIRGASYFKELDRKNCVFPAVCKNLAQTAAFTSQITTEAKRVNMDRIKYLLREEAKYLENAIQNLPKMHMGPKRFGRQTRIDSPS